MLVDRRSLVIGAGALGAIGCGLPCSADIGNEKASVESSLRFAVELTDRPPVRMHIHERMARYGVPGASVAVMRSGALSWSAGYGVRRTGGAARVTPSTVFQAASLSKPVTALGALRLVDKGAVKLNDDVNEHLRNWRLAFAPNIPPQPITLELLLSHTGGVNVPSFPGFKPDKPMPSLRAILDGAPEAATPRVQVDQPPGKSRYSGGGYMVVEQLIEDLSDTGFTTYMQQNVLGPAGMRSSAFEPAPPDRLLADIASGHGWRGQLRAHDWLLYPQHAAASLWSTAEDLVAYLSAVVGDYRGSQRMGFGIESAGGEEHISHSGWNTGYRSYIAALPRRGDGIAVMTNADSGADLALEIVRSAAHVYGWPSFAPRRVKTIALSDGELNDLAGTYKFTEAGFQVTVSRESDHFRISAPRGDYTFYATSRWNHALDLIALEDGERGAFVTGNGGLALHLWGMQAWRND